MAEKAVNVRKAIVAANLIDGESYAEAMRRAGYAPSTARNPTANGIVASQCLSELARLNPDAIPANLLGLTRARLLEHLESVKGATMKTGEIARLVDVTERSYGAGEPLDALDELRDYGVRMRFASELARRVASRATPQQIVESQQSASSCDSHNRQVLDVTPDERTR